MPLPDTSSTTVYFIRHGIAAERGTYANDDDRPLTAKGRSRTTQVAQRLKALGWHVDDMLTSPLVRAQQTAAILLAADLTPTIQTTWTLAPEGRLQDWLIWLGQWQSQHPHGSLGLVGHEPDLSTWAQHLVMGQVSDRWLLKKAGIIGVKVPTAASAIGNSELFWLTPPRLLLSPC